MPEILSHQKKLSELLSACDVYTFKSGGRGGQHQNKTESGVRLVHRTSGITVVCRQERSQHLNKIHCLEILQKRLEKLYQKPKPRIATPAPYSMKIQRQERKKRQSMKKKLRKRPVFED